ncbi:MAG: selenocysteine-specific translation elongation factor [Planctomycetes bacterium]|nr:selenocysteine-specific translation elongation factor [Planctomycetota bacterium]
MPRDLILGTAGHIDHGKTALMKALTGIDCDRLPEEKKRGITIDIGFAYLDLGEYRLGIVDVPGHERFIRNMLAGATGIDLALLVISAGESIKPQTLEHLEILKLLDLRHGVIALTKIDLVDATMREVVALEIRELVRGTFLEQAPLVATSAFTGEGIEELREALRAECSRIVEHRETEWFRLAIDRSFVVQGHGTVVTGSVLSGSVRVSDEVAWHPSGEFVRIRALHHHDQPVDEVHRGQRAALNLAGVPHEQVQRGQELACPGYLIPSKVLTVRLQALPSNRRPLRHRAPARFHIGTAEVMATLSLLDCDAIEPGSWGLAQLFLEEPVVATWGQPFVLRDSTAEQTLGGGTVLQPVASKIRRRHIETLEHVEKLVAEDPATRVEIVNWFSAWHGFTTADLVRDAGVGPDQVEPILRELMQIGKLVEVQLPLHAERVADLEKRVLDLLARLHQEKPLLTTHDRPKTLALLDYIGDDSILQAIVDRLISRKLLVGDARRIARADFKPKLSINQRKLKDKLVEAHREAGFQPPDPKSFAAKAAGNTAALDDIFEVAVAEGLLVRIAEGMFLHAESEAEMRRRIAVKLDAQAEGISVAEIRDLLGTTRKFAIPLCEYLDQVGVTRREGDLRVLGEPDT